MNMGAHRNPKPTNHFSTRNIADFLNEHFRNDTAMHTKLTGLFDGVREDGYKQGRRDAGIFHQQKNEQ